jgi:aminoglycoside 6'-N-acetyltransferase
VEYHEESEPMYRHAGIDIYLGQPYQGRGVGTEVVGMVARFLIQDRGHHRLTIDPAAANVGAIRCYAKVGSVSGMIPVNHHRVGVVADCVL